MVGAAKSHDDAAMESLAGSRTQSFLVEDDRDFLFGVMVQQSVDFLDHGFVCFSKLGSGQGKRKGQGLCDAAFEADMDSDLITFDQGYVFEQQTNHALSFTVWCLWVLP